MIAVLEQCEICGKIKILETAYFSSEQFTFKIRTTLLEFFTLQIRIYCDKGHYDYSYQLFSESKGCRWDNAEHFPYLKSFPHHFHTTAGKVMDSPLKGEPIADLRLILAELDTLLERIR